MQTILITGANRGLGLEMVKQYLQAGWHVIACCRTPRKARELAALANSATGQLTILGLDVQQVKQVQRLPSRLKDQPIDILVNNAGIFKSYNSQLAKTSTAWLETFQINTIAPALMAKSLVEQVAASQRKIIVNISSVIGSIAACADPKYFLYGASKAALNYASKSLALELKPRGITVAAIHPGWVKTDMGGVNAELTATESVAGIRQVLDALSLEKTGIFCDYKGEVIPY